mgnify:FL=1
MSEDFTNAPAMAEEIKRLREALTPSTETKAAYIGEFHFTVESYAGGGEKYNRYVTVPWTTVKEIMAAILARAEDR